MFYIVETREQLQKVIDYPGNSQVYIEIIPLDDRIHPALNTPSLIYFRPLRAKRGFIIAIDHTETFLLSYDEVLSSLINGIPEIFTIDKKTALYYGFPKEVVKGLKMAYTLSGEHEFPNISKFNTPAHRFFSSRTANRSDINRFIPVSKHYEKFENFFHALEIIPEIFTGKDYHFYNTHVTETMYDIEKEGIGINPELFNTIRKGYQKRFNVKDNRIYSSYNLFNATARPSCNYNSFNFLGLNKENGARNLLVPTNDIFVEFDYKAYQVKLLADLIGYDFKGDDIHKHFAELYGEDYETSKRLTFKYLYGRSSDPPDVPFFQEVYALRDYLWDAYQEHGYVKTPIAGRKILSVTEITQILPYLMQAHETERNVQTFNKLKILLSNYYTKVVLYTYDAFLFDFSLEDGQDLITLIKEILEEGDYQTSFSYGPSYGELFLA